MTRNQPSPPRRPSPPTRPRSPEPSAASSKPYHLISLPPQQTDKATPAGQDRFRQDSSRLSGKIHLRLAVKTSTFVASGVVAMGSDLSDQTRRIPLIKTSIESDQRLLIPGSSFKGVVRSAYEAITRSCLCKVSKKYKKNLPRGYQECEVNQSRNQTQVCPACRVFGALNWQGLVRFTDATCENTGFSTGFMPSLYRPRPEEREDYFDKQGKVAGRKFYYHAIKAVDKGQQQGIPVQQAGKEYVFATQLQFMNLMPAELGTLLIVLGQDSNYPIALKVGGGKPVGMGTMVVEVREMESIQAKKEWRDRYSSYHPQSPQRSESQQQQLMQEAIQAAHRQLVQSQQLQELATVLKYPTNREPPEGMY